jgi:uroporphyrinogen III methyltransferase/synthase
MEKAKGKVYLVGAGPGDIGLLTVKGLRCLGRADVVVYDFHLNAQVLNYINHDAEFVYAGKRGGHHTMTQEEINRVLVDKAKEGKAVCRLKGGDPFVFGRGGEEAQALSREGIDFEVVPGVSSAIAAPAYAGIPLTHRQYSSSFAVIPGNEDPAKEDSSINWSKLATGIGTLVFLMAVKNIDALTRKLIENGRSPDTPVAIIRWGTRADQKTVVGTLGEIASKVVENDIKPPAVVVVGDVVTLRDSLMWYEKKPLFGQRILVTREHSGGFEALEELGAEIIEFPTIEVVPPESWEDLDRATDGFIGCLADKGALPPWIIFTSANGVRYFFRRLSERGKGLRHRDKDRLGSGKVRHKGGSGARGVPCGGPHRVLQGARRQRGPQGDEVPPSEGRDGQGGLPGDSQGHGRRDRRPCGLQDHEARGPRQETQEVPEGGQDNHRHIHERIHV